MEFAALRRFAPRTLSLVAHDRVEHGTVSLSRAFLVGEEAKADLVAVVGAGQSDIIFDLLAIVVAVVVIFELGAPALRRETTAISDSVE